MNFIKIGDRCAIRIDQIVAIDFNNDEAIVELENGSTYDVRKEYLPTLLVQLKINLSEVEK